MQIITEKGARATVVHVLAEGGMRTMANGQAATGPMVWITDDGGVRSVTNDAEGVVSHLHRRFPGYRIIYRDSEGKWDELVHDNKGAFTGYRAGRHLEPGV